MVEVAAVVVGGDHHLVRTLGGPPRRLRSDDNPVRYSPAGPVVRVSVANVTGAVEFRVSDNGPGVLGESLARLGERSFRQTGSSETGSGLGLSIVRRIVELHRATVAFAANRVGPGLSASVRLPARDIKPRSRARR